MRIWWWRMSVSWCDGIAEDLRLEKYTVDCCYDGAAACERLFVEPYDLVVLDLNLPGMDGWSCSGTSGRNSRSCGC